MTRITTTHLGYSLACDLEDAIDVREKYERAVARYRRDMEKLLDPVIDAAINKLDVELLERFVEELPNDVTYRSRVHKEIEKRKALKENA